MMKCFVRPKIVQMDFFYQSNSTYFKTPLDGQWSNTLLLSQYQCSPRLGTLAAAVCRCSSSHEHDIHRALT